MGRLLPGSAAAVAECAGYANEDVEHVQVGTDAVVRAVASLSWTGSAADLCAHRVSAGVDAGRALVASFATVGTALMAFATTLAECESQSVGLDHDVRAAHRRIAADPFDLAAWRDYITARAGRTQAAARAESAAADAAAAIRTAIGRSAAADALEAERLRGAPVPDDVLDRTSWDPQDVGQRGIGDCYLLSSLMALMRTDAGDDLLRRNVRWDESQSGYWVTLYREGEPFDVFVDATYLLGARQGQYGDIGVVSLYEAAVGIHLGYPDFNDGGWPKDALELVTGGSAREYETGSSWWNPFDDRFGDSQDEIAAQLADGAAVTADTSGRPSAEGVPVVVECDGSQVEATVTIVGGHAYSVERIDDDGNVWVRNPWGAGNSADDGNLVRLTSEQFATYFRNVTVAAVP